jgi:hypothetical protein
MPTSAGSSSAQTGKEIELPITKWEPTSIKIHNPTLLRSDNYPTWRMEAQIHLDNADVWELVCGEEISSPIDTFNNFKRKNKMARSILVQLVSDEYKGTIGNHSSAHDAWKSLEDTLDRKNVSSTIHPVNAIFDMRKDENTSMLLHITEFESKWTVVNTKVSNASSTDKDWLQGLKLCFNDPEFKAHLLLRTLPSNLENVVDNLQTKSDLTYSDVRTKLLDLNKSDSPSGDALMVKSQKKKTRTGKAKSGDNQLRPGIPPRD